MTLTEDELQFLDEVFADTSDLFEIWVNHMEEDLSLSQVRKFWFIYLFRNT